jgi:hypothetical protein
MKKAQKSWDVLKTPQIVDTKEPEMDDRAVNIVTKVKGSLNKKVLGEKFLKIQISNQEALIHDRAEITRIMHENNLKKTIEE